MKKINESRLFKNLIIFVIAVIPIIIYPINSFDAVNIPKLTVLTLISFILLQYLFQNARKLYSQEKLSLLVCLSIVVWGFILTFIHTESFTDALYGVEGRRVGLLAYIGMLILFLTSILISKNLDLYKILDAIIFSGSLNVFYTLLQIIGVDPINWKSSELTTFGFLGNVNFNSTFIAITCLAVLNRLFIKQTNFFFRIFLALLLILGLISIYGTGSTQGFLLLIIGTLTYILLYVYSLKIVRLQFITIFILLTILLIGVLDILQKSLIPSVLYEPSISFRGDYWRSALRITVDNPIFGLGHTGFRDHYKIYRDDIAANRGIAQLEVDSPHNFFLELLTTGGVINLILFLLLLANIALSAVQQIRSITISFNGSFMMILVIWITLIVQSTISPNQIGILVITWILAGLIVGSRNLNLMSKDKSEYLDLKKYNRKFSALLLIPGILISGPLFYSDIKFRNSIESGNLDKILDSSNLIPRSVENLTLTSEILRTNGFNNESLQVIHKAIMHNPQNLAVWQELRLNPLTSDADLKLADVMIKKLDPNFTDNPTK